MTIYKHVKMVLDAICVMDGNNSHIIHYITKQLNVKKNNVEEDHVLTIILKKREE